MKNRVKYLFIQYYKNHSTKIELDEFFDILKSAEEDEEISSLIKIAYEEILNSHASLTYINKEGELVVNKGVCSLERERVKSIKKKIFSAAIVCFLVILPAPIW